MIMTRLRGLAAFALFALIGTASAQPSADQQAEMLLNTARKAYADANPQFAAEKFREFLGKYGAHKDANSARYGLGLALLDLSDRDYQKALDAFTPAASDARFGDQPLALYFAGVSRRGLGQKELAEGAAASNEMPQRQQAASGHFTEAGKFFAQRPAFESKPPPEAEWAARGACDSAEMELRLGKSKEARTLVEPFVKDSALAKSQFRPLGLYYHGFACFLMNDILAAGKSLNQLARSISRSGFTRYLMGRTHARKTRRPRPRSRSQPC